MYDLGIFCWIVEGAFLVLGKVWRCISAAYCSENIVPHIDDVVSQEPGPYVMRDNAPPHRAGLTMREFDRRNMYPIEWPLYSPNLNPIEIEIMWGYTKDYMDGHNPQVAPGRRQLLQEFRTILSQKWDVSIFYIFYILMEIPRFRLLAPR